MKNVLRRVFHLAGKADWGFTQPIQKRLVVV